jgi:hypothetical protein
MKKHIRGLYLFISSLVIGLISLPLLFAKSAGNLVKPSLKAVINTSDSLHIVPAVKNIYDSLHLNLAGLSLQAYDYARRGFNRLLEEGRILNDSIISIIDFSQPSSAKRLYILDVKNDKILFNTLVAHGKNTGLENATSFSNEPSSLKSSTGFYMTGTTYDGHNGYSLRLVGLEPGLNDRALDRGIVVHGAAYVNESLAHERGYVGRSWGCPAVPKELVVPVIETIRNGSCLYIYHPSQADKSSLVH